MLQTAFARSTQTERIERCPNCGSTDARVWARGRDRQMHLSDEVFESAKCGSCGVIYQSVRPAEDAIGTFYSEGYGPYGVQAAQPLGPVQYRLSRAALRITDRILGAAAFRSEIDRFYARMARKPRFLDFGCGSGKFLDRARKLGCDTIGMDFSPVALAEVSRRGHRALAVSEKDWDAIEDGSVDMVRMNHVVEHLYDARAVLSRLYAKLAPGGQLHAATPNADSEAAEKYREQWFGLDCPRHIVIYTPDALRSLLEDTGFRDVKILQEPLAKDRARSWVYREVDAGRRAPSDVTQLADNGLLNLRFAFAARNAARRGRSDRIHAIAEKPRTT
jgi:SAM-dependent methyltransferase